MSKKSKYIRILSALTRQRLTLFDFCDKFNIDPNTVSGRFTELKRYGFIESLTKKPNKRGNLCALYRITGKGKNYLTKERAKK